MTTAELVQRLARAWNTNDDEERMRLLQESCLADAEFLSPHGRSDGLEAYARGISIFRKSFRKARLSHGAPTEHHGFVRFAWRTDWNDGRDPVQGMDFGELDASGKVRRLVSFTNPAEPPA